MNKNSLITPKGQGVTHHIIQSLRLVNCVQTVLPQQRKSETTPTSTFGESETDNIIMNRSMSIVHEYMTQFYIQ